MFASIDCCIVLHGKKVVLTELLAENCHWESSHFIPTSLLDTFVISDIHAQVKSDFLPPNNNRSDPMFTKSRQDEMSHYLWLRDPKFPQLCDNKLK